jgi:hypothetical protein
VPPKCRGIDVTPTRVGAAYQLAVADEQKILELWPDAKGYKTKNLNELAFSPVAEQAVRDFLNKDPDASQDPEAAIARSRAAHKKALKQWIPGLFDWRPSEFISANLLEAWMPYGELILTTAGQLKWKDFSELKTQLHAMGFDGQILNYFRPIQQRRYFLKQTPASIATMIVSQRHSKRIGSQEAVRTAGKHLYSRIRSSR